MRRRRLRATDEAVEAANREGLEERSLLFWGRAAVRRGVWLALGVFLAGGVLLIASRALLSPPPADEAGAGYQPLYEPVVSVLPQQEGTLGVSPPAGPLSSPPPPLSEAGREGVEEEASLPLPIQPASARPVSDPFAYEAPSRRPSGGTALALLPPPLPVLPPPSLPPPQPALVWVGEAVGSRPALAVLFEGDVVVLPDGRPVRVAWQGREGTLLAQRVGNGWKVYWEGKPVELRR